MSKRKSAYGGKILTLIGACAIVFAVGGVAKVHAGIADNVKGWIWGGSQDASGIYSGLGWISMNSTNCDIDGDGRMDRVNIAPGTGDATASAACPANGTTIPNYGVKIPTTTGAVTGYVWSENMGSIKFAPAGPYPAAPNYSVTRNGDKLEGWARIVDIAAGNAGGNSGWIKMSGTAQNGSAYGVTIGVDGKLVGYAWSDEFGAISFSGTRYGALIPGPPTITVNLPIMINVKNTALPQTETLTWSSTNAGSCDVASTPNNVWTQIGIGISGTHNVNVAGAMNETFKLTCHGFGGLGDKTATTSIATVCYPQTCALQACGDDTASPSWGVVDASTCSPTPPSTCKSNDDCTSRSSGKWIEVEP